MCFTVLNVKMNGDPVFRAYLLLLMRKIDAPGCLFHFAVFFHLSNIVSGYD